MMIWDDNELQLKLQYKQSMMCDHSHAININGDDGIKQTTIMCNQKNAILCFLQAHNNISAQQRCKFLALCVNSLIKMHDLFHALCINGGDNVKQVTIMLNN